MALAEGEGFEPPVDPRPTAIFETAALNRSANPPRIGFYPVPKTCQMGSLLPSAGFFSNEKRPAKSELDLSSFSQVGARE